MTAPRRAALVAVSLIAAGAAAAQNAAAPAAPAAPDSAPAPVAANGNPLAAIAIQSLTVTRERPLFTPSRRPPPPPVVAAPVVAAPAPAPAPVEAPPETPPFKLIGTIVGGDESIAIFFNPATNATTRVHAGKEEAGWKVTAVNARAATLEKGSQNVTLDLPKPGEASSAPAVSAVPGLPTPEGEKMDPDP